MSPEQKELYQAAYCGLCHAMARRHGWLARYTLNYDFTFLALLCLEGEGEMGVPLRCPAHPIRGRHGCLRSAALDVAADESIILTWHKLQDDIRDKGFWGRMGARLLSLLFRAGYRRAADACPTFDKQVSEGLERLSRLEREGSAQLDRVADAFASILRGAAPVEGERAQRVVGQLLYHVGRWIYLVDAWDDWEADRKNGCYNPLVARFEGRVEEAREDIAITMTHSLNLAISAANLMDFGGRTGAIENILHLGLPTVQQAVLSGQWKQLQKKRRETE